MSHFKTWVATLALMTISAGGLGQQANAADLQAVGTVGYQAGYGVVAVGVIQNVGNLTHYSEENRRARCRLYFPSTGDLVQVFDEPLPTMEPGSQYWPHGIFYPTTLEAPIVFLDIYTAPGGNFAAYDPNPNNDATFFAIWHP